MALAGGITLGVVFYVMRVGALGKMSRTEFDYLILGEGSSVTPHGP